MWLTLYQYTCFKIYNNNNNNNNSNNNNDTDSTSESNSKSDGISNSVVIVIAVAIVIVIVKCIDIVILTLILILILKLFQWGHIQWFHWPVCCNGGYVIAVFIVIVLRTWMTSFFVQWNYYNEIIDNACSHMCVLWVDPSYIYVAGGNSIVVVCVYLWLLPYWVMGLGFSAFKL